MTKKILYISFYFLILSCATKKEKLTFSKFIISDAKGYTEIEVEENGSIYISDNLIGLVDKEGTITTKHGTLLAEVDEQNFIHDADGNALVQIDKNGTVENSGGDAITWSENGLLLKNNQPIGFKIFPANKESFQTASILLYLHRTIK
ncbi:conserved hypothetical protein [Flavobacterium sp. 9AF]|uniref:hypothetical protein n=1 Tax=Flavobacterium sp. 9AF TaxID=2653142 RepID=UPI0012F222EC|nr:hypothetical protein [Flavobacterium sp. 9AF]VXA95087.1 conserved hypothetical protein [Flavobacterium sp. 9AF]